MKKTGADSTRISHSVGRGAPLSVVVPFFNEAESVEWVLREVRDLYPEAEIVAVDDGSTDGTWDLMRGIAGVRAYRLRANRGQSAALWAGLQRATRPICVILDGDGQNDPADIVRLVGTLGDADVACGFRRRRQDTLAKRLASKVANGVRRIVLGDGIRDTGCALKAFPREHLRHLLPFDGLHRFLPALFRGAGLRLVEVGVDHRPRRYGQSKYGNVSRAVRGLYDLLGVTWLLRRRIDFPPIDSSEQGRETGDEEHSP